MFEFDDRVELGVFVRGIIPSPIVEDVAVLIDLDKCRAFVLGSSLEHFAEVFDMHVD